MKLIKTLLLVSLIAFMLSACGSKKAALTKKYYRLNLTSPATNSSTVRPITLVVKRPEALSILGGRPIVATQTDTSLVQLSHNFWIESPKILLQDLIKNWAENYWQDVVYQPPSKEQFHWLKTRILAFEKRQEQAIAEIEFSLYDQDNQLLLNQRFDAQQDITADNYDAFSQAMSLAIDSIFTRFNEQLNQEL